MILSFN